MGVISDTKQTNVTDATQPEIYFCLAQIEPGTPLYGIAIAFMQVAIRGRIPADSLRTQFDKVLHQVAPDATTTEVKTIHEAVEDSFGSQKLIAHMLEGFAALALMIASVGLYGLLSFAVAQRTREIGLRIALGAPQANILNARASPRTSAGCHRTDYSAACWPGLPPGSRAAISMASRRTTPHVYRRCRGACAGVLFGRMAAGAPRGRRSTLS